MVLYASAHLEEVDCEFLVRDKHACLENSAAIEEVRRILLQHLAESALSVDQKRDSPQSPFAWRE